MLGVFGRGRAPGRLFTGSGSVPERTAESLSALSPAAPASIRAAESERFPEVEMLESSGFPEASVSRTLMSTGAPMERRSGSLSAVPPAVRLFACMLNFCLILSQCDFQSLKPSASSARLRA